MTILITGASGFIGQYLLEEAIKNQEDVIALCNSPRSYKTLSTKYNYKFLRIFPIDLFDLHSVCELEKKIKNVYIYHLAAYILQNSSQRQYDKIKSINTNIIGTINLVSILKEKISGICLTSTLDVYGTPIQIITESHPLNPTTYYAISKLAAEFYLKNECIEIPLAILRLSHVYGLNDPHQKVLQSFMTNIKNNAPSTIYGDGTDLRDYIHVKDVIKILIYCYNHKINDLFNVASGISKSISQIYSTIITCSQKTIEPIYTPRSNNKIDYIFNIKKLESVFGKINYYTLEQYVQEFLKENK